MMYLIFLCFWMSVCFASQDSGKLEKVLLKIITEDNNEISNRFTTHQQVEQKIRELNGGMLPLSLQVKQDVKNQLKSHFNDEDDAIDFFKEIARKHLLYPLSVEKTIAMIQSEYAIAEDAIVIKQMNKLNLELDSLQVHTLKVNSELYEVQIKRERIKAKRSQAAIRPFRLVPLKRTPVQTNLSIQENS